MRCRCGIPWSVIRSQLSIRISQCSCLWDSPYYASHRSPRSLRRVRRRRIQSQLQDRNNDHPSGHFKLQDMVRDSQYPLHTELLIPNISKTPRFDIFVPAATKLPEHMRSQHYQNPTQPTNSAFACATGSEFWNHLKKTPEHAEIFNNFMATRRQGKPNWHDIYPIEQELSSENIGQDDILLVDVGGNRGHDLVNIRAKHPRLVGKMVVQDLPSVVAHASFPSDSNITAMPHDFFSPQPIQCNQPPFPSGPIPSLLFFQVKSH